MIWPGKKELEFAKILVELRKEAGMTCYALARDAGVDASYLARLERGEKRHPSRELVLRLGQVLLDNSGNITLKDINRLLKAAGYGPLPRNRISILPSR